MSYRVEEHEHGMVIVGPIPVSELLPLMRTWKRERRLTWCDAIVAQHLGASMVCTTKEGSDAWRKELGLDGRDAKGVALSFG